MITRPSAYTPEDDALIRSMYARGFTDMQIGVVLGKSAVAIRRRRHRLPMTAAERLVAGHRRGTITVREALVLAVRLRGMR